MNASFTPKNQSTEHEIECLAKTIYHEARGEPLAGQMAVAWTTLNRKARHNFPKTICGVIKQPNQYPWEKKNLKIRELDSYNSSVRLARDMYYKHENKEVPTEIKRVQDALFFNVASLPLNLPRVKIGKHTFYIKTA